MLSAMAGHPCRWTMSKTCMKIHDSIDAARFSGILLMLFSLHDFYLPAKALTCRSEELLGFLVTAGNCFSRRDFLGQFVCAGKNHSRRIFCLLWLVFPADIVTPKFRSWCSGSLKVLYIYVLRSQKGLARYHLVISYHDCFEKVLSSKILIVIAR